MRKLQVRECAQAGCKLLCRSLRNVYSLQILYELWARKGCHAEQGVTTLQVLYQDNVGPCGNVASIEPMYATCMHAWRSCYALLSNFMQFLSHRDVTLEMQVLDVQV